MRFYLGVMMMSLLLSLPTAAQSTGAQSAPELMAALARIPERHATFSEEKVLTALAQPLLSSGTLSFRQPDHLEKITLSPRRESLIVDGRRLSIAEDDQPARVLDLSAYPEIRALVYAILDTLRGDLPALMRSYDVQLTGDTKRWQLTLLPADQKLARFIRVIAILGTGTELRSIRTLQPNGDEYRMTIEPRP